MARLHVHLRVTRWGRRGALPHLVLPLDDGLEEPLLGAVEGQAARQQDEEDDSAAPHVHRLAVGLPLHNLRGHEVGGAHSTCGGKGREGEGGRSEMIAAEEEEAAVDGRFLL